MGQDKQKEAAEMNRCMTKAQAMRHLGLTSESTFSNWVARGILPGPIPGTRRWDAKAIDRALDRMSNIAPDGPDSADAFDKWKASLAG